MPRNRKEFETQLLQAFRAGMNAGYGVDHTDKYNEEIRAERSFVFKWGFVNKYEDVKIKG